MNIRSEKKILTEFLKILDDPVAASKRFRGYGRFAITLVVLVIFFLLSDHSMGWILVALIAFGAGVSFGLGIWFLQAGLQTGIIASHISKDSIARRLQEIDEA
jgi:hypothetical protein